MARENTIKVSDEEKKMLDEARLILFETDEVPYGVVISTLCEDV